LFASGIANLSHYKHWPRIAQLLWHLGQHDNKHDLSWLLLRFPRYQRQAALPVVTRVLVAEYANVNEPFTPSLTHLSRIALNDIKICVFSKWKF
jgi:hypothetical protein